MAEDYDVRLQKWIVMLKRKLLIFPFLFSPLIGHLLDPIEFTFSHEQTIKLALNKPKSEAKFSFWFYQQKPTNPYFEYLSQTLFDSDQQCLPKEKPHMHHQGMLKHDPTHAWKDPTVSLSPPPKLMDTQMGVVETPGIPPLGYERDGNVKVFHLVAQPVEKIMVDSSKSTFDHLIPQENKYPGTHHPHYFKKIKCWGYNGSMPGPTIEVTEGDRIRIIIKNELPEPTSIHWHGLEIPNNQDGAVPETAPPILPGQTFTYEFTLYQSGTLMYHSGFNIMKQDHIGLSGIMVIHPKKYEEKIDKQFAIMLEQWSILPGSEYLDLVSMDFNWFTFNGLVAPSIPVLTVNQGDRVRIRFANMIMDSHPIHIHGYIWEEVGTEGGPIQKSARRKSSTILVPAGTTRDVEFVAWNPGLWRLHCHKLHHVINAHADIPMSVMPHGGMFTLVHVIPKDPQAPWQHPRQKEVEETT